MKALTVIIFIIAFVSGSLGKPDGSHDHRHRKGGRVINPDQQEHFRSWARRHRIRYGNQDVEKAAMETMLTNKEEIDAHNERFDAGEVTFKRALWKHSDKTFEEKRQNLMGLAVPPESRSAPVPPALPQFPVGPVTVDWGKKGLVGPVEDQGWCGCCWAFSAAGVVDAVLRRKKINAVTSQQQFIDCANQGCWGCSSGWPKYALDYAKTNGGANETTYPFMGNQGACYYKNTSAIGFISNVYEFPTRGNETWLRDIVASVGPVSIVFEIDDSFQSYSSGIYNEPKCGTRIDHAMLLTGYGTDPVGGDYWIVKNSWGTSWGEGGYIRVARNRNNMCGIAYYAVYAT